MIPRPARKIAPALVSCCILAWCALWVSTIHRDYDCSLECLQEAERCAVTAKLQRSDLPVIENIMTFEVCNGLTNQRISIITGFSIAKLMNRDVLLPQLLRDYRSSSLSLFSSLYDLAHLRAQLYPRVLLEDQRPLRSAKHKIERAMKPASFFLQLALRSNGTKLISFDCTFFALDFQNDEDLVSYAWLVHRALRFVSQYERIALKIVQHLRSRAVFLTVVHGRYESDWKEHCASWKGGFNCQSTAAEMLSAVSANSRSTVIYVAQGYGESLTPYSILLDAGYQLHTKESILPEVGDRPREESAAIDAIVSEAADLFIGNSVSTFSAMQILSRKDSMKLYALSNGGGVPLDRFLPPLSTVRKRLSRPMCWVFYHADTEVPFSADSLLVAVQSARERTSLRPVCLFSGSLDSPIARWLSKHGVLLIQHKVSFTDEIRTSFAERQRIASSTFEEFMGVVGTVLNDLHEEEVILYTGANVIFLGDVRMSSAPMPSHLSCSPRDDRRSESSCDPRILFLNVANMRHSRTAFARYAISQPALQQHLDLVLSTFYRDQRTGLSAEYSWKPYWPKNVAAKILFFDGPTLPDIAVYVNNGTVQNPRYTEFLQRCDTGNCRGVVEDYSLLLDRARRSVQYISG